MRKTAKKFLSLMLAAVMVLSTIAIDNTDVNAQAPTQKVNYALGATATANDTETGCESFWGPDKAVDGIVNRDETTKTSQSRWSTNRDSVIGEKVLTVDLGEEKTFSEFVIEWERANIKGFEIQVSSDAAEYTSVYRKTNDSYVNLTTTVTLDKTVTGRYVKLVVDNYDGGDISWESVSLYEFKVIGVVTLENLALNAKATANAHEDSIFAATKANDGTTNRDEATNANQSRWASSVGVNEKWLQLDFGAATTVASVVIEWERCNATDYRLQYSNDASAWTDIKVFNSKPTEFTQVVNFEKEVNARYIRLLISDFEAKAATSNGTMVDWATVSVYEFEAYAATIDTEEEGPVETIDDVIAGLEIPEVEAGSKTWVLPEVPERFQIEFVGADYEQVIGSDLSIYQPIVDKTVSVQYKVFKGEESKETSTYNVAVSGKYAVEESDNVKPVVIPELAEWKGHTGDFAVSASTKLVVNPEYKEELVYTAESFAADYEDVTGNAIEITYGTAPATGDFYFTLGSADAGLGEEGYLMTIADYVTVEAVESKGAFWAVQTVMQILKQTDGTMPKGITRDYPKFEVRGFMLDVGRKPFTMEYIYETVKTMAYYKMNDLALHLNDNYIWVEEYNNTETDQWGAYSAFRLESDVKEGGNNGKNKADLTSKDLFYTKDEFRTLIQDARKMGIDIVPEFDAPAHSLAFTKVRPDLSMPEDSVRRWADHLYLANPESEEFIKSVWDEYITGDNPVFDKDTILNIGTDEYEGNSNDFRQFTANMINYVQDSGRTVRLWGSLSAKTGSVEVPSEDVQMYIWSTGWANPRSMYDQGYNLINIQDTYVYMVPNGTNNRGGYGDRLNLQNLYNNWKPNVIGGATIPATSPQMLGGSFAIWNDNIDLKDNGLGEYDIFDRFVEAAPYIAAKAWGEANGQTFNEFTNSIKEIGLAPSTNPLSEVESETDTVLDYDFDESSLKDDSGNKYDGSEGKNTAYATGKEGTGLKLNGGSSYVTTPLENMGPKNEVSFWIKLDADATGEQIIFESEKGALKAAQKETGKVGFSRECYDFSFDYELPKDEWVYLTIRGYQYKTELYVNGELQDTLGKDATGGLYATFVLPLERIGSKENAMKGLIDEVTVGRIGLLPSEDPSKDIPLDQMTAISGSQYLPGTSNEGPDDFIIDGNADTHWHTNWATNEGSNVDNRWVGVEFKEATLIGGIRYLPRTSGGSNGAVTEYKVQYREDTTGDWIDIASGTWSRSDSNWKYVEFEEPVVAKQVRVVGVSTYADSGNNAHMSTAELHPVKGEVKVEVNKTALEEAIAEAKTKVETEYTEESWTAFESALNAAKEILANEEATQEDVDAATENLLNAANGLEKAPEVPPVNPDETEVEKDELREAYELCLEYYVKENHSEESWEFYQEVLKEVEKVLANEEATEEDVIAAAIMLAAAVEILEAELEEEPVDPVPPTDDDKDNDKEDGKTDETDKSENESPVTGDNTILVAWSLMALMAMAVVLGNIRRRHA